MSLEEPYLPPPPTVPPPQPPTPQYAPQYPQYPQAYGYPPAPYPTAFGPQRPGTATGGAVVGFVLAGLMIFAGALLMLGASLVSGIEDSVGSSSHIGLELAFDGVVNLLAAGLLIAGGTLLLSGKAAGRRLLLIGNVIVLVAAVYWLARFGSPPEGAVVWALLFSALAGVSIGLAVSGSATRWLSR